MKRYALLLAADRYRDPGIQPLRYAERDARVLEGFLRESAGFDHVEEFYGEALTKNAALDAAERLADELAAAGGGLLLLFYAGHGFTHLNRHCLLTPGARLRDLDEFDHAVTVDKLKRVTARPRVERQLVVDACRSNLRVGERQLTEGYTATGLRNAVGAAPEPQAGGWSVLASCDEGEQASEVEILRHGVFAWAWLEELRTAQKDGREVRLDERLVERLRIRVAELGRQYGLDRAQRPWVQSNATPPAILRSTKGSVMPPAQPDPTSAARVADSAAEELLARIRAVPWHYRHRGFEAELLGRASSLHGKPLSSRLRWTIPYIHQLRSRKIKPVTTEGDPTPYLTGGFVSDIDWEAGRPVFTVDLDALAFREEGALLQPWFSQMAGQTDESSSYAPWLERRLSAQDQVKVWNTVPEAVPPWVQAALNLTMTGDVHEARLRVQGAHWRFAKGCAGRIFLATAWQALFREEAIALRLLTAAESCSDNASDWVSCAQAWCGLFGDATVAKRCLRQAELGATSEFTGSINWARCAVGWKHLFDDDGAASRCLEEAESQARYGTEWTDCADSWNNLLGNTAASRRCLQEAEDNGLVWATCARSWKKLFNEETAARRCLKKAESKAYSCDEFTASANDWKVLLNDTEASRRCLQKGISRADDASERARCGTCWAELLNDDAAARQCLQHAETKATTLSDWLDCARVWVKIFNDEAAARRCLQQAETKPRWTLEWIHCAEAWKSEINDEVAAKRCLQHAESKAAGSDWRWCAEGWAMLNDEAAAKRCEERHEAGH